MSKESKDKAINTEYTSVTVFIPKTVHMDLKIQCIKKNIYLRDYLEEVITASVEGKDE